MLNQKVLARILRSSLDIYLATEDRLNV